MRIWNARGYFLDFLIEFVGIKAGIALSEDRLVSILDGLERDESDRWWHGDRAEMTTLRAEEVEWYCVAVMHQMGAVPDQRDPAMLLHDFLRDNIDYFNDPSSTETLEKRLLSHPDFAELMRERARRDILNFEQPEDKKWDGIISLDDLFESEGVPTNADPDAHFDQRYIDYLTAQPDQLTSINWRQFERLTAEYFARRGYTVTVGPGRADGGKDITALKDPEITGPDLVVIQCKRLGKRGVIEVEAVKAFWTTVNDVGATRGLIATTGRLRRGAREYCDARKYRLTAAEGDTVRRWIREMASFGDDDGQASATG